jgi:Saccharopine dehydrogenase and related proteins
VRIAILGCGAVGSVFARIAVLEKLGEVVCMDRSVERARVFLDFDEVRDLPVEQVDASRADELLQKLRGFDFVVNALPTFLRVGRREVPLNPLVHGGCAEGWRQLHGLCLLRWEAEEG